jgi:hypothetical protein
MNLNLTISVDDINPKKGYRLIDEPAEKWFRQLNEEFGCKFTLFIPSCYHNQYPLSQHKEWVRELNSIEWLELAAHGNFHDTSDRSKWGECEMFEPNPLIAGTINDMLGEWYEVLDTYPIGFRPPGWLCSENAKNTLEQCFRYVAVHYEHNRNLQWDCKTFFGHDGIQQEHIEIHNISPDGETGMIMFQSHIAGKHNHNVWSEENYNQLRMSLTHLFENYEITPKLLKECL